VRTAARICLALVVVMILGVVVPGPTSRIVTGDALAQIPLPTPTIPLPDPSPDPTPTPTESPTPKPKPTDDDDGGDSGGGGSDDGSGESGSGTGGSGGSARGPTGAGSAGVKDARGRVGRPTDEYLRVPGSYSTDNLMAVATRLRALGWAPDEIAEEVFPPFIVEGPANWIDSWGAPRFGPGAVVRTHKGQDVFCRYGDPVLAAEPGTIEYGEGGLGGIVARLHRSDGSYWYYAHLADTNDGRFPSGSQMETGDVIGYCGNTGNAITTPPHVHFGWYQADGSARNPMRQLVRWLAVAEERALIAAADAQGKRVARIDSLVAARRFGDAFVPDLSELSASGESLWSSGSTPASGTFALAEAALQAALAGDGFGDVGGDVIASPASVSRARGATESLTSDDRLSSVLDPGSTTDVAGEVAGGISGR
jgi:hypothetical protein